MSTERDDHVSNLKQEAVGYCKPPRNSQFIPGRSRNPGTAS